MNIRKVSLKYSKKLQPRSPFKFRDLSKEFQKDKWHEIKNTEFRILDNLKVLLAITYNRKEHIPLIPG